MREITEKEIKLKQQLLESPAHHKVKDRFDFPGMNLASVVLVPEAVPVTCLWLPSSCPTELAQGCGGLQWPAVCHSPP